MTTTFINWEFASPEHKTHPKPVYKAESRNRDSSLDKQVVFKCEQYPHKKFLRENYTEGEKKLLRMKMRRSFQLVSEAHAHVARAVSGRALDRYPVWVPEKSEETVAKIGKMIDNDTVKKHFDDTIRCGGNPDYTPFLAVTDFVSCETGAEDDGYVASRLGDDMVWRTLGATIAVDFFFQNCDRVYPFGYNNGKAIRVTPSNFFFDEEVCIGSLDQFHTQTENVALLNLYAKEPSYEHETEGWAGDYLRTLVGGRALSDAHDFWKALCATTVDALSDACGFKGDRQLPQELLYEGALSGHEYMLQFARSEDLQKPFHLNKTRALSKSLKPVQLGLRAKELTRRGPAQDR
jgi:hypothetical protein